MTRSTSMHNQGDLSGIWAIVRREVGSFFTSRSGIFITALFLGIYGLVFNAFGLSAEPRYSTEVLAGFFYAASGCTMVVAPLIAMRLIAEERQTGTLPLLMTSSLSDGKIVLAKFLSGYGILGVLTLATVYLPALIFINGRVSVGHIAAGYVGLLSFGAAIMSIGLFASAIAPNQLVAIFISGTLTAVMVLWWWIAKLVDGPFGEVVSYLALVDRHYAPFMDGTIPMTSLVFYLSVCLFFLLLARTSLEGRRFRP
jgi:ABC-2 type transport system permease protein